MSALTRHLDSIYPEYDWWGSDLDFFVDDLATRGIMIGTEQHRYPSGKIMNSPAISFSGFSSQGDGLAFDCDIDWAVFCETHPDMAEQITEWWLLLSTNPSVILAGTRRHSRGNSMSFTMDYEAYEDTVEHGFFAGMDVEELPVVDAALDTYMTGALEDEADEMYCSLERQYDSECEYLREQEIETIKADCAEELAAAMHALPDVVSRRAADEILGEFTDIDFTDLEELGLYVWFGKCYLKKEIVCTGTPESSGVRKEEE